MKRINSFKEIEKVYQLLAEHTDKKRSSLSLIPTENILSPLASAPLATDLVNRYFLLDNTIWEFPQTHLIQSISEVCDNALKTLFNVQFVNTRPISGLNCMTIIIASLTKAGQIFYSMSPFDGGHGATSFVAKRLGLKTSYLPFNKQQLDIDIPKAKELFHSSPPDFIYIDISNFLFPISLKQFLRIVPSRTFVYFDCSQIFGLILNDEYFNPMNEGLPLIGGSTHKTFPGPQKGMILSNNADLMRKIEPYTNTFVSSHHVNSLASLCISSLEMLEFGKDYAKQVLKNAATLGNALSELGIAVQKRGSQYTGSHQLWIDPLNLGENPSAVVKKLNGHNIVTNCARIPTIRNGEKGIRVGTTEVTRLGMKESEMKIIAELFVDVVFERRKSSKIIVDVAELRQAFPSVRYCYSCTDEFLSNYSSLLRFLPITSTVTV